MTIKPLSDEPVFTGAKGGEIYDKKKFDDAVSHSDLVELVNRIDFAHSSRIADLILDRYTLIRK